MYTETEWDQNKSRLNFLKHSVLFSDAESVLYDPYALTLEDESAEGEQRHVTIGMDALGRFWLLFLLIGEKKFDLSLHVALLKKKGKRMKREYDFRNAKRGAVIPQKGKTRITIYIDDDIINEFRDRAGKAGKGYQTIINDALREYIAKSKTALDEETLRRIIREELKAV